MREIRAKILGVICTSILCGIFAAGLWPFHAPKNEVTWLPGGNGLRFGEYGTILSSGVFSRKDWGEGQSCTIEIWVVPGLTFDTNTLLAFYSPTGATPFSVRQSNKDLLLVGEAQGPQRHGQGPRLYVDDVFLQGRSVFLTIASDGRETSVFANGALVMEAKAFWFCATDLIGQMVVANSPAGPDTWSGELRGLALYNQALTAAQVLRQYGAWTQSGKPDLAEGDHAIALYLFDERSGSIIRNLAGPGPDLYIPEHFMNLHQALLQRPWDEYHPGWGYWKEVLVNIGGFIPLGFFFCAYVKLAWHTRRAALITIACGAAVSVTIEVLQAFLPTRDSGMTDIITNTLGTAVGAGLFAIATRSCGALSRSCRASVRDIAGLLAE
jgi:VanZ family protein